MTEQIFQRSNAVLKLPADSLLLRWGDLYKLAGFLNDTLPRSICSFQFIIEDEKIQNFRNICKIEISYKKHTIYYLILRLLSVSGSFSFKIRECLMKRFTILLSKERLWILVCNRHVFLARGSFSGLQLVINSKSV
jgi:hypothetical protein